jgi:SecD/SecF fusion protein
VRLIGVLVVALAGIALAGCGGGDHKQAIGCGKQPDTHALVYRARAPRGGVVDAAALEATVKKLCERARRAGAAVAIHTVAPDRIEIDSAKPLGASLRGSIADSVRLAFYDWEPNLLPPNQQQPELSMNAAVRVASKQRPRAEPEDVPPGGPSADVKSRLGGDTRKIEAYYDRQNDAAPASGVPRGVAVLKDEARAGGQTLGYWVLEDDAELTGADIRNPRQGFDPTTGEPLVSFDFTAAGRAAFARATKREAARGAATRVPPGGDPTASFQRFAIALDGQIVSLATINYRENPEGIRGDSGAQINGLGNIQDTQNLAANLATGPLPVDLTLVSSR